MGKPLNPTEIVVYYFKTCKNRHRRENSITTNLERKDIMKRDAESKQHKKWRTISTIIQSRLHV